MPCFINSIQRNICINSLDALIQLVRFAGYVSFIWFAGGNISEPFTCKFFYLVDCDIASDAEDGIQRPIVLKEKSFYSFKRSFLYMLELLADSHPLVGVLLVCELTKMLPGIAIRFVEVVFL